MTKPKTAKDYNEQVSPTNSTGKFVPDENFLWYHLIYRDSRFRKMGDANKTPASMRVAKEYVDRRVNEELFLDPQRVDVEHYKALTQGENVKAFLAGELIDEAGVREEEVDDFIEKLDGAIDEAIGMWKQEQIKIKQRIESRISPKNTGRRRT